LKIQQQNFEHSSSKQTSVYILFIYVLKIMPILQKAKVNDIHLIYICMCLY